MAVWLVPSIIGIIAIARVYQATGVPVPTFISPEGIYDLWGTINDSSIRDFKFLIIQNLTIWMTLYIGAYVLTHIEPQASFFRPLKFNKKYPKMDLVAREFSRSVRGVFIATAYEALIHKQYATGALPVVRLDWLHVGADAPIGRIVMAGLLMYLWGDAHFYWTHRFLHTPWFYKNVHSVHHQSRNTDPFSGLSMHWLESAIYFTAAPLCALWSPLWLFRLTLKGLLVFPLEGHAGFGTWAIESSHNHYLHHTMVVVNFGSSPFWDRLCGTNYKYGADKTESKRTGRISSQQRQKQQQQRARSRSNSLKGSEATSPRPKSSPGIRRFEPFLGSDTDDARKKSRSRSRSKSNERPDVNKTMAPSSKTGTKKRSSKSPAGGARARAARRSGR